MATATVDDVMGVIEEMNSRITRLEQGIDAKVQKIEKMVKSSVETIKDRLPGLVDFTRNGANATWDGLKTVSGWIHYGILRIYEFVKGEVKTAGSWVAAGTGIFTGFLVVATVVTYGPPLATAIATSVYAAFPPLGTWALVLIGSVMLLGTVVLIDHCVSAPVR
jgi:hypothetical protein